MTQSSVPSPPQTVSGAPASEVALSSRRALAWTAGLAIVGLPAALGSGALAELALDRSDLLASVASGGSTYWLPERALQLWVLFPLLALSATVLFLAPGLLLAAGFSKPDGEDHTGAWIARGFAFSMLLVSVAAALATQFDAANTGSGFGGLVLALSLSAGLFTAWRAQRVSLATLGRRKLCDLSWCLVPPLLLLAGLAPKFLWEDFNGDGAHAFEAARLLLERPLPFWDPEHVGPCEFPGITSFLFLYPLSWFIRLVGPLEVAVRLAYLPFLVLFFSVCLWAIEGRCAGEPAARRLLRGLQRASLWLGLLVYSVTLVYSATYSPHNADIALPATQDTFVVAAFVAYAICLWNHRLGWACVWLLMTWFAAPNGPLLVMCAIPACLLSRWPIAWKTLGLALLGVVVGSLAARGLALAMDLLALPPPGDEYASESLASRFKFLLLVDWRRFLFALLPAGITPFVVYAFWPKLEAFTRFLALVALGSFFVFYIQAGVALHHFVPAMLLPIAAFWRWRTQPRVQALAADKFWTLSAALGALLALALVRPHDATPRVAAQAIGATLSERSGEYARSGHAPFARADLLFELYPFSADPRVPDESYGGSWLVWLYYAKHELQGTALAADTNVVLQGPDDPAPFGFELIRRNEQGALWLRDRAVLDQQLAIRQPTPAGSSLLTLDRATRFRQTNSQVDPRVIDVRKLVRSLGF